MFALLVLLGMLVVVAMFGGLVGSWTGCGEAGIIIGMIIAVLVTVYYLFKKN